MQLDFANKEKVALQTILEGKVLPLAEEVSRGLSAVQSDERVAQQVTTLQRLLAATVAAMARANSSSASKAAMAAAAVPRQQQGSPLQQHSC